MKAISVFIFCDRSWNAEGSSVVVLRYSATEETCIHENFVFIFDIEKYYTHSIQKDALLVIFNFLNNWLVYTDRTLRLGPRRAEGVGREGGGGGEEMEKVTEM